MTRLGWRALMDDASKAIGATNLAPGLTIEHLVSLSSSQLEEMCLSEGLAKSGSKGEKAQRLIDKQSSRSRWQHVLHQLACSWGRWEALVLHFLSQLDERPEARQDRDEDGGDEGDK